MRDKSSKGFTLVEMLAVVAIVVLVGGAIATGTSTLVGVYEKMMFTSNSGVLEDDINTTVIGLASHASDIYIKDENVYFVSNMMPTTNDDTGARIGVSEGELMLLKGTGISESDMYLVNPNAYLGMTVQINNLEFKKDEDDGGGVVTFEYTITSANTLHHKECKLVYRTEFVHK